MALVVFPAPAIAANFTISWEPDPANADLVKAYRVYQADDMGSPFTLYKTVTRPQATVSVPTGSSMIYRIKTVDTLGQVSGYSWYVTITITTESGP